MTNEEIFEEFRKSKYANFQKFLDARQKEETCTIQKTTEEEKTE